MLRVSILIVLVGACVASAGFFRWKQPVSVEFQKINDWLVDNLPGDKDGYANVRKAAEYYATQKSSMKPEEQQAWELFTSLAKLENECTVEAAKIVHRNFDEASLDYPEGQAILRIESVLQDVQAKRMEVCEPMYHAIVRGDEPLSDNGDLVGDFLVFWQRLVNRMPYPAANEFPETERKYFGDKFEKIGDKMVAKLIYESIETEGVRWALALVKPTRDEKTGNIRYASEEAAETFVKVFYDECNGLTSNLGDKVDLMMSKRGHWILRMYRRVELCKRLTATYKPENVAKELVKISKNNFRIGFW